MERDNKQRIKYIIFKVICLVLYLTELDFFFQFLEGNLGKKSQIRTQIFDNSQQHLVSVCGERGRSESRRWLRHSLTGSNNSMAGQAASLV